MGTDPLGDGTRNDDAVARRTQAALAGHRGDEDGARHLAADPDGRVRATALGALARMGALSPADINGALSDPDPRVRRRACEVAGRTRLLGAEAVVASLADEDSGVAEMAAWSLGELGSTTEAVISALSSTATSHDDALCREAAVAALGALGDDRGLPVILAALGDRPAVRRRAVLALAPFEGPDVDAALQRALSDRDWQVRQAAEDLTGR